MHFIQVTSDACKNTVVMGLSVQNKTVHKHERPLDGKASLEENKKRIEQIIKKRRGGKGSEMKNTIKTNLNTTDGRQIE